MKGETAVQSVLDKKDIEWTWKTVTGEATETIYIIHITVMFEPFGKKKADWVRGKEGRGGGQKPLNQRGGQNVTKGEKYKLNKIKGDIDKHAVSESQKNVTDRPQSAKGRTD